MNMIFTMQIHAVSLKHILQAIRIMMDNII